jgi:hypothetical protein
MRPGQGDRRLVLHQRDGLCPRTPRRLRSLGGEGADRMVLRACVALFPPPGVLGRRSQHISRRRRAADDAEDALRGPARRRLFDGCPRGRPPDDRGLQRSTAGGVRPLAADNPQRAPLQRRVGLFAARSGSPKSLGRHRRAGDEDPVRRPPRRRGRVPEGGRAPPQPGPGGKSFWREVSSTRRSSSRSPGSATPRHCGHTKSR